MNAKISDLVTITNQILDAQSADLAEVSEQLGEIYETIMEEIQWDFKKRDLKLGGWIGPIETPDCARARRTLAGRFDWSGTEWMFELEADAVLFALKWQ
jgi:hypothetical protein